MVSAGISRRAADLEDAFDNIPVLFGFGWLARWLATITKKYLLSRSVAAQLCAKGRYGHNKKYFWELEKWDI